MSADILKAKKQLGEVHMLLKQGKLLAAVASIHDALGFMLKAQLMKHEQLAFTEALTQIGVHGVSDALYRSVAEHFSDVEISELNFAIVASNAWSRLGITWRMEPGSLDVAYGLNRANLE